MNGVSFWNSGKLPSPPPPPPTQHTYTHTHSVVIRLNTVSMLKKISTAEFTAETWCPRPDWQGKCTLIWVFNIHKQSSSALQCLGSNHSTIFPASIYTSSFEGNNSFYWFQHQNTPIYGNIIVSHITSQGNYVGNNALDKEYLDKYFFFICRENVCCGTHYKGHSKEILITTHNIVFCGEIRKISIIIIRKKHVISSYFRIIIKSSSQLRGM